MPRVLSVFSTSTLIAAISVALLLAAPFLAFAQKEANTWIMGAVAAVRFNSGSPQKLPPSGHSFFQGSTTSDEQGNLLFFTSGKKVWDRNYHEMPNGTLTGTSNAGAQVVPRPGDPTRYFVFSVFGTENFGAPFMAAYYSEVDMCLNNGLGDVVLATKNTALVSVASRHSAVVRHSNGIDYWVALHKWNSNQFHCYLVTKDGVQLPAVVSNAGPTIALSSWSTGDGGQMKFSPDGRRLAMAISQYATAELFDFNATTGQLTSKLSFPATYRQNYISPDYTSGIEFSPNGELMYLTRTTGQLLLQYDLSAGTNSAILQSRTIIVGDTLLHSPLGLNAIYGLQLGPQGKLYVTGAGVPDIYLAGISVINEPNEKGADCLYQNNLVNWGELDYNHTIGLFPTFPASYFIQSASIRYNFDCISPLVPFFLNYPPEKTAADIQSIQWDFGDPPSGPANQSTQLDPSHAFMSGGLHTVKADITWVGGATESLKKLLTIPTEVVTGNFHGLGNDTTLCMGASLRLDGSHLGGNLTWQNGSTQNYFDVTGPGVFWVRVCRSGCSRTDSVTVDVHDVQGLLGPDTVLCANQQFMHDVNGAGDSYQWQNGSTSPAFTITQPGTYWVKVKRANCFATDSVVVLSCLVFPPGDPNNPTDPGSEGPEVRDSITFIPNVITPNDDGSNDMFSVTGIALDVWSLVVCNRFGREVFRADDYQNDWTGSDLSSGTYYYFLRHSSGKLTYQGWVQIVR